MTAPTTTSRRPWPPGRPRAIETWLPETGIAACPGSNETSRTHASALWTADYALNAAQLGITRIGFHSSMLTCKGGPPMSAICTGGPYLKPNGEVSGRANFFGISMVAELEAGKFLKVDSKGGGLAFSYALQNADGSTTVVLVNENDPEKAAQTDVTVKLPARALTGTMTQMTGPSYGAEDSTLIDGAKSEPDSARGSCHGGGFRLRFTDADVQADGRHGYRAELQALGSTQSRWLPADVVPEVRTAPAGSQLGLRRYCGGPSSGWRRRTSRRRRVRGRQPLRRGRSA